MKNWSENKMKWFGALAVFLISFGVYFATMAPTVSFWDCGEFVACAHTLGIPHPPGTPFYILFARFFIIILPFMQEISARVNIISVLTSALTVVTVFLIAWDVLAILFDKINKSHPVRQTSMWTGALSASFLVCFSDTVWFNAVEAEVYGLSMFMVFLMTWLSVVWSRCHDTEKGDRLLIFIAYVGYLGVGAHLYSLLTIPAIFVFMMMVSPKMRSSQSWPIWLTGVLLYAVVYKVDAFFSILLWTTLGMSIGYILNKGEARSPWRFSFWFCVVALLGYSTHAYIPIRSSLNPVIDENNPEIALEDAFSPSKWGAFNDFIGRKQYGSESMLSRSMHRRASFANQLLTFPHMGYGGYQIAQYLPFKVGEVRHHGYGKWNVIAQDNEPLQKFGMTFPTQMSSIGQNKIVQFILFLIFNGLIFFVCKRVWAADKALSIYLGLLYVICSFGLVFYMNFADGTGSEGYAFKQWVAAGKPDPGPSLVHMEVRERDYFFTPAFVLMGLLYGIGLGLLLLTLWEKGKQHLVRPISIITVVLTFIIPCYSNYAEHDRSGLFVPWDYAYNLINSCQPNSVLFTNGDNDTFPLWFIQEVEGIRKDVRVVNLSLGNTDWYIQQILEQEPKRKLNSISQIGDLKLLQPTRDKDRNIAMAEKLKQRLIETIPKQKEQIAFILNPAIADSLKEAKGEANYNALLQKSQENLLLMINDYQMFDALANWGKKTMQRIPYMRVQDQLIIDLVRSNPNTPIHFATTVGSEHYVGLDKYMNMDGMVWTLKRGTLEQQGQVNIDQTLSLVDSTYKFRGIGDGTAHINSETMRLLYNYNSIYIRLALDAREKVMREVMGSKDPAVISAHVQRGMKYISKGIAQFPAQWRNYVVGSELLSIAGQTDKAKALLEQGLTAVAEWDQEPIVRQIKQLVERAPQAMPIQGAKPPAKPASEG